MLNYDNYVILKGRNVIIMILVGLNVVNVFFFNGGVYWFYSVCLVGYINFWEYMKNKSLDYEWRRCNIFLVLMGLI